MISQDTCAGDLHDDLGLELDNAVFALDASPIDLCLSVFPRALFCSTCGSIPTFVHVSHAKLGDVDVLDLLLPDAAQSACKDISVCGERPHPLFTSQASQAGHP